MKTHFGQQLKAAREARGFSQKALGDLIGVASNNISQVELGNQAMRWDNFEKAVDVLGEPASYFFSNERPAAQQKPAPTVEALTKIIAEQEKRINQLESALAGYSSVKRELIVALASINDEEAGVFLAELHSRDESDFSETMVEKKKTTG